MKTSQLRLVLVLVLTSFYLVVEVIGGILTHSLALLADAGHMLTDVGALAIALFAMKMAERPANSKRTYGYYRAEILAALANTLILVGISFYIFYEAFQRLQHPAPIITLPMLWVASIGLGVNIIGLLAIRQGAKSSLNIRGAYYEVLVDLVSSVGVIAASLIIGSTGWYAIDPILSAGIGLFILPGAWLLMRESVGILLEGTPPHINIESVHTKIKSLEGVIDVHELHIWSLTSGIDALSAHIIISEKDFSQNGILKTVNDCIRSNFKIHRVTIQVEQPGFHLCQETSKSQLYLRSNS